MQGMMYTRPHSSILDDWGKDNPGWSSQDVLQYFIKSENNLNPELVEPGYHGFSGPMIVQQFPSRPPLADVVVEAGTQLGYRNGDLNGHNQTGAAVAQMMVYEGLRASTARMYLRPFLNTRENLKVSKTPSLTSSLECISYLLQTHILKTSFTACMHTWFLASHSGGPEFESQPGGRLS
jgi:choline dehydrogenase-like flavoprotein